MNTNTWDTGSAKARAGGNDGDGIGIGWLEVDDGRHRTRMSALISAALPRARQTVGSPTPAELWRVAQASQAVALPFVWPDATALGADWVFAIRACVSAGVCVFGGTGNGTLDGTTRTLFPAAHPEVIAVASVRATDGTLDPLGSSPTGRIDIGLPAGVDRSSGACVLAACVCGQWTAAGGQRLFGPAAYRVAGFRRWLEMTGRPLPDGRGVLPMCWSL